MASTNTGYEHDYKVVMIKDSSKPKHMFVRTCKEVIDLPAHVFASNEYDTVMKITLTEHLRAAKSLTPKKALEIAKYLRQNVKKGVNVKIQVVNVRKTVFITDKV